MIIGRLVGYFFLCMMIMVSGAEGLRFLEGKNDGWITISVIMDFIDSKANWLQILDPLRNLPVIFTFMVVAILMFYISRDRIR